MTNKYIDHLTVDEYKFLQSQLVKRVNEERKALDEGKITDTKEYTQLRFMELKVKSIIKKHQKKEVKSVDISKYM